MPSCWDSCLFINMPIWQNELFHIGREELANSFMGVNYVICSATHPKNAYLREVSRLSSRIGFISSRHFSLPNTNFLTLHVKFILGLLGILKVS